MLGPFAIQIGIAAAVVGFRRDRRAALKKERPRHVMGGAKLSYMQQPAKEGRRDRAYPLPTQDVTAAEHQKKSPAVARGDHGSALAKSRAMSNSGAVTLGDIAGKLPMLNVACSKCERRGLLSVANLIAQHGADMRPPDLRCAVHLCA